MKFSVIVIIIIMILGIFISSFLLVQNTNILYKQKGSTFSKNVMIKSTDTQADGGYIRIISNQKTRSAMNWATFDNGEQYYYFTINPDEMIKKRVNFSLPSIMDNTVYYVDFEIKYLSGKTEIKTISFRVI